jgi:hypothetical protein
MDNVATPEEVQAFLEGPAPASAPTPQLPTPSFDSAGVASPEEASAWLEAEIRNEKYGGLGQQFLAGLEGAASSATFGLSTGLETLLGVDPEDIRGRREENPLAYGAGQVAGLVGSVALPGAGALGLMERVGVAGAKALGLGAAQGASAKIAAAAVKAGIENTLQQSGDELSKFLSADPAQTAETAMANITLSGLLGSGIGGAFGSINPLWKATFGAKTAKNLEKIAEGLEEAGQIKASNETVQILLAEQGASLGGAPKPNIDAIDEAAARLGLTPTTGTRSGERLAQDIESTLSQRPTFYGQKIAGEVEEVQKGLNRAALDLLGDATNKTKAEVGREIKEGIAKKISSELDPIEANYEKLKPQFKAMEVPQSDIKKTVDSLLNNELVQVAPTAKIGITAKRVAKEIQNLKNVDQLKSLRTIINKRVDGAMRTGSEELPVLLEAKKLLTGLREASIEQAAIDSGIGRQARSIAKEVIDDIRLTDKQYRSLKTKLKDLGTEAGLGNVGSARVLAEKFAKSSDESLATKIFDTNDINQLNFFKKNFPEQYELALSYKKKEILENSISHAQGKNGDFDLSKFLTQVRKLSPEAKLEIFGSAVQSIDDIKLIYQAMPGRVGPSGTPKGQWLGNLFSPQGLIDNLSDAGKYAMLKAVPVLEKASNDGERAAILKFMSAFDGGISAEGFRAMGDFMEAALNGEKTLNKAVRGLFKATRMELPRAVMPDEKKREKLDKRLQNIQTNPQALLDAGGETGVYLKGEASHLAQVAASAVNYLNSLRPAEPKQSPLDPPLVPSKQAKAEFNRALDIAEQPLIVIEDIRNGQVSMQDLAVLKTIYPSLYTRMAEKIVGEITDTLASGETIPYKMRLGLSLFLGQPMDSTMTGESIRAIQASSGAIAASDMQQKRAPSATSMQGMEKLPGSYMTNQQSRVAQKMKT